MDLGRCYFLTQLQVRKSRKGRLWLAKNSNYNGNKEKPSIHSIESRFNFLDVSSQDERLVETGLNEYVTDVKAGFNSK